MWILVLIPIEVYQHLLSYRPKSIDFLLPLNDHSRPRPPHEFDRSEHPYGEWFARIYDLWVKHDGTTSIRYFSSIMNMWLGRSSLVESIGLLAVDLVVIETNGDIEAVDSLKAVYRGAAELNFNIRRKRFQRSGAARRRPRARQSGVADLCATCKECPIVGVCGGGYIPHRYSANNGFNNPSVYCRDLTFIIEHVGADMQTALNKLSRCGLNPDGPWLLPRTRDARNPGSPSRCTSRSYVRLALVKQEFRAAGRLEGLAPVFALLERFTGAEICQQGTPFFWFNTLRTDPKAPVS